MPRLRQSTGLSSCFHLLARERLATRQRHPADRRTRRPRPVAGTGRLFCWAWASRLRQFDSGGLVGILMNWREIRRAELRALRKSDPIAIIARFQRYSGLPVGPELPHDISFR